LTLDDIEGTIQSILFQGISQWLDSNQKYPMKHRYLSTKVILPVADGSVLLAKRDGHIIQESIL
jgi:hypothetical protein